MRKASTTDMQLIYEDALRQQRRLYGAAEATVEAVMFQLRQNGLEALRDPDCQDRLAMLLPDQIGTIVVRLDRLRPKYPAIDDRLLLALGGLL